jgi:hypothetical protein
MSTVSDLVKCPQCGYEEADHEFDCRTRGEETLCNRCGYRESWEAKADENGQFLGWKHDISKGFGVVWYRGISGIAFACRSLHSEEDLAKAESWLREQLAAGTVEWSTARLTRWNNETRSVDLVLGTLDYPGKMAQVVADLGLEPISSSRGAVRFAMLPGKAAVVQNSSAVIAVLHYLNADPATGKYSKGADGSMPMIEWQLGYLALSRSELDEIKNLEEQELSLYDIDIVMSASSPEFGRVFRRVCNRARWTLDPATEKQVKAVIVDASSELATKCTGRSGIEVFPDLRSAKRHIELSKSPKRSAHDQGAAGEVTTEFETAKETK